MSQQPGFALRGTTRMAVDIAVAIRFDAMVDRRAIELLRTELSPDVIEDALRRAADAVIKSGLFETAETSASQ